MAQEWKVLAEGSTEAKSFRAATFEALFGMVEKVFKGTGIFTDNEGVYLDASATATPEDGPLTWHPFAGSTRGEPSKKKQRLEQNLAKHPRGLRKFCVTCGQVRNKLIEVEGALSREAFVNHFKRTIHEAGSKTATPLHVQDVAVYHKHVLMDEAKWLELLSSNIPEPIYLTVRVQGCNLSDWNGHSIEKAAQDLLGFTGWRAGHPRLVQKDFPSHPIDDVMPLLHNPFTAPSTGRSSGGSVNKHALLPGQPTQPDAALPAAGTAPAGDASGASLHMTDASPAKVTIACQQGKDANSTSFDREVDRVLYTLLLNARLYEFTELLCKAEPAHRSLIDLVWQLVFLVVEQVWRSVSGEKLSQGQLRYQAEVPIMGTLSWGKLDWAVIYNGIVAFAIEAKGVVVTEESFQQVYASVAAVRDMLLPRLALNEDAPLIKPKHYQDGPLSKLPTYAALCQANKYILLKYLPAAKKGGQPTMVQSQAFSLNLQAGPKQLREELVTLVKHGVGVLLEQLKALQGLAMDTVFKQATDDELKAADSASQGPVQPELED